MSYDILFADGSDGYVKLAKKVSEAIERGWEPLGGIAIGITQNNTYGQRWAQAMIKRMPPSAAEGGGAT